MRDAARALDDVSDHLGEVVRRADQLLADWSGFGAQVRSQIDREVAGIGAAVDGAVARAAGAGLDHAIADRLRALTVELERLEQRSRAAARAVADHREADRRVLWIVVAGVVLANALLVVLLLRKPSPVPPVEPIKIESRAEAAPSEPAGAAPVLGGAEGSAAATDSAAATGSASTANGAAAPVSPGSGAASTGSNAAPVTSSTAGLASTASPGSGANGSALGAKAGSGAAPSSASKPSTTPSNGARPADAVGARPNASPISLPPKSAGSRPHKKVP